MWRRGVAAVMAGVLVSGGVVPRAAADEMTQWYYEITGIKAVHEKGYDGKGVKIALIDGKADLTMPELKGVDAKVKTFCSSGSLPEHEEHASNVLATMAAPVWGWAPKATYTVYAAPVSADGRTKSLPAECQRIDFGFLLSQALNDKNDVVVVTTTSEGMQDVRWIYQLVRAAERGVPVVVAAGNEGKAIRDAPGDNLTVAAGAATREGRRWEMSNYGPELTMLAAAEKVNIRNRSPQGTWEKTSTASGTSFAAPQIGAILALGRQAYPGAHGNQLIRTLIATANSNAPGFDPYIGHGVVNAQKFLRTDPTKEQSSSPLAEKNPKEMPTATEIQDYRDGIIDYLWMDADNEFKFRGPEGAGCDQYPPERRACGSSPRLQSASPTPNSATSASPSVRQGEVKDGGIPWWWTVTGLTGLVLLGAAVTAFFLIRKHP